MKRKFLFVVSLMLVTALAACGPRSAPTVSAPDMQNTALANALTEIALTPVALPTNTFPPPTPVTELATITALPTLESLPTVALQPPAAAPAANASPTPDCYQPPAAKLLGDTVQIRLVNKADGPVNLSFGMYEPNAYGECFTFAFSVGKNGSEVVTLLSGCYWGAGYQNGPEPSTPRVDYICFTDTAQTRGLTISNNSMGFD